MLYFRSSLPSKTINIYSSFSHFFLKWYIKPVMLNKIWLFRVCFVFCRHGLAFFLVVEIIDGPPVGWRASYFRNSFLNFILFFFQLVLLVASQSVSSHLDWTCCEDRRIYLFIFRGSLFSLVEVSLFKAFITLFKWKFYSPKYFTLWKLS